MVGGWKVAKGWLLKFSLPGLKPAARAVILQQSAKIQGSDKQPA
jgi:hypothetical protein